MRVAVTAVGADRPGIVASVTQALYEVGANLEDSRMAILGGHFALVVMAELPQGTDAAALDTALDEVRGRFDLALTVGPVADVGPHEDSGDPYVVSVYGADRPGIVASVTELLATRGINIVDLRTHAVPGEPPLYIIALEASVPAEVDVATLAGELRSRAAALGVDVAINPAEPETL